MNNYIFDIDGTLSDVSHRQHHLQKTPKDWDAFNAGISNDAPRLPFIDLLNDLNCEHRVILLTGRDGNYIDITRKWLVANLIYFDHLYMRAAGDRRCDTIVKSELADQIERDYGPISMVFEDRDRVVAMWRARGIACAQVNYGDF